MESLTLCGGHRAERPQSCPTAAQILVVVDNDNASAAARSAGSDQATDWRDFVEELTSIGTVTCGPHGERPLERLPAACTTIQSMARGAAPGACRSERGQLFPRFIVNGEGHVTPATEVVGSIEKTLKNPKSAAGVVFLAFDSVVDGDYRDASPHLAFADAVSQALKSDLALWIVASPVDFRYVYVFARPQFETFAGQAAEALAGAWRRKRLQRVIAVNLSQDGFRNQENRAATARVAIVRLPAAGRHWTAGGLRLFQLMHGPGVADPMWRVSVDHWLSQYSGGMDAMGGGVELTWESQQKSWDVLVPFGVRLPAPTVLVNRTVMAQDVAVSARGGAWVSAPLVKVGSLNGCQTRLTGMTNAPFSQAASFHPGRADFVFLRGAIPTATWLRAEPVPNWPVSPDALIQGLSASANGPLAAAALVSPNVEPNPCTRNLLDHFRDSWRWGSDQPTPELRDIERLPECSAGTWPDLIAAIGKVRFRRFNSGATSPWPATDGRVSVATFLTVVEKASLVAVENDRGVNGSCILATVQMVGSPQHDRNENWQAVPLH